jgi:hypothetical protein
MPDPTPILQAIDACFAASPSPPTGGDLAAAVLRAAVEQIEHLRDGADCADHLEALADAVEGTDAPR